MYDAQASIIGTLNPNWMRRDASGQLRPPPVTNFSRANAAEVLKAADELGAKLLAASAAARAFAGAADGGPGYGGGAVAAVAAGAATAARATTFKPTTVQVADLFKVDYYGTWKLVTNLVTGEVRPAGAPATSGGGARRTRHTAAGRLLSLLRNTVRCWFAARRTSRPPPPSPPLPTLPPSTLPLAPCPAAVRHALPPCPLNASLPPAPPPAPLRSMCCTSAAHPTRQSPTPGTPTAWPSPCRPAPRSSRSRCHRWSYPTPPRSHTRCASFRGLWGLGAAASRDSEGRRRGAAPAHGAAACEAREAQGTQQRAQQSGRHTGVMFRGPSPPPQPPPRPPRNCTPQPSPPPQSNLRLQDRYLATPSFCVDACGQFVARALAHAFVRGLSRAWLRRTPPRWRGAQPTVCRTIYTAARRRAAPPLPTHHKPPMSPLPRPPHRTPTPQCAARPPPSTLRPTRCGPTCTPWRARSCRSNRAPQIP